MWRHTQHLESAGLWERVLLCEDIARVLGGPAVALVVPALVAVGFGGDEDDAAMESFFSLLQKNALNTRRWDSRDQLRITIITWIERTYHQRRRQAALGRLTPTEYQTIMTPPTTLAA